MTTCTATMTISQPPPTLSLRLSRVSRKNRLDNNKMPTVIKTMDDADAAPVNITGTNVPELRRAGTVTTILEEEEPTSVVLRSAAVPEAQQPQTPKKLGRSVTLPENALHINQQRTAAAAAKAPRRPRSMSLPATVEKLEQERSTKLEDDFHRFQYTQRDIVSILKDQEAFETLQLSLRQRSCVTNTYLKLNVHFYVQHVKSVREARMAYYVRQQCQAPKRPQNQNSMPADVAVNRNQNIMPTMRERN